MVVTVDGALLVELYWWRFAGGGLLLVLEKLQCVLGLFPP